MYLHSFEGVLLKYLKTLTNNRYYIKEYRLKYRRTKKASKSHIKCLIIFLLKIFITIPVNAKDENLKFCYDD